MPKWRELKRGVRKLRTPFLGQLSQHRRMPLWLAEALSGALTGINDYKINN